MTQQIFERRTLPPLVDVGERLGQHFVDGRVPTNLSVRDKDRCERRGERLSARTQMHAIGCERRLWLSQHAHTINRNGLESILGNHRQHERGNLMSRARFHGDLRELLNCRNRRLCRDNRRRRR